MPFMILTALIVRKKHCSFVKNASRMCTAAHTRLYRHHVLLGRDKIHVWQGAEMLKDRCLRHTYTEADMYCRDHDVVCCHLCITTDHR